MKESMEEIRKRQEEEQKKKECPFNPKLACEDCRLYKVYQGGHGASLCLFERMVRF